LRWFSASALFAAASLLGCEVFIGLGEDYTEQCAAFSTVYRDADGDGDGNEKEPLLWCGDTPPGYVTRTGDCDDDANWIHTRAPDDQCDGIDQDCDGALDEDFPGLDCAIENATGTCEGRTSCQDGNILCIPDWHIDADGDGFGDDKAPSIPGVADSCVPPEPTGTTWRGGDCDDDDALSYPGAPELCDSKDQSCDGALVGEILFRQTFSDVVLLDGGPDAGGFLAATNSGFSASTGTESCGGPLEDATPTSDERVVGVGLSGCVAPLMTGELWSPVVDTSARKGLSLEFHAWIGAAPPFGTQPPRVTIEVRQGIQRTRKLTLSSLSVSPDGPTWTKHTIDIGDFIGPNMSIAWTYESGDAPGWGGFRLDDVVLVDEPCTAPPHGQVEPFGGTARSTR